jgi:hypothetical protein
LFTATLELLNVQLLILLCCLREDEQETAMDGTTTMFTASAPAITTTAQTHG